MHLPKAALVWLAATALLLGASGVAPAEPLQWPMPTEYPADSMPGVGETTFATELSNRSGGRIAITPSFNGADGLKSAGIFAQIEAGQLRVGDSFTGALGGIDPIFLVSSLPFLVTSFDEARTLYEVAAPYYANVLRRHHQRLLYATPWPPSGLWANRGVIQPGDLSGLAIRTYDSTGAEVLKAMGAVTFNIPYTDVMARLKDGSLQGVLSSGDGGAGRRFEEYLLNFTTLNYAVPLSFATMSVEVYEGLPPDLRQAIDEAGQATEAAQWKLLQTRVAANLRQMSANGVTVATPSAELTKALANAGETAVKAWAAKLGADGDTILREYRARR